MIESVNDLKRLAVAVSKLYLASGRSADELTLEAYRDGLEDLEIELLEWAIRETTKTRTEFVGSVADIREIYYAELRSIQQAAEAVRRDEEVAEAQRERDALTPAERDALDRCREAAFEKMKAALKTISA